MSEQSITIQGVPPSVTSAQVTEALHILGVNPHAVVEFTVGARADFTANGVAGTLHVTVYADGAPGHRWTGDGKTAATHRLTIPILDKEPPE